jgi:hypothetical protein
MTLRKAYCCVPLTGTLDIDSPLYMSVKETLCYTHLLFSTGNGSVTSAQAIYFLNLKPPTISLINVFRFTVKCFHALYNLIRNDRVPS